VSSQAALVFREALKMVNRAIGQVFPGLTLERVVTSGEFEQGVFMLWVAARIYLFDDYLPKRREELIEELLRLHPSFQAQQVFTREEVAALLSSLVDAISSALGSLRQGQTSIRGNLFEHIASYPLQVLFDGKQSPIGEVRVLRTPKKRRLENVDLTITAGSSNLIGLSVKGNIRERIRESIERARNAIDKGYFQQVWHVVLTSRDAADKEALNSISGELLYYDRVRIYTWTPLCHKPPTDEHTGGALLPLSRLPSDISNAIGVL